MKRDAPRGAGVIALAMTERTMIQQDVVNLAARSRADDWRLGVILTLLVFA